MAEGSSSAAVASAGLRRRTEESVKAEPATVANANASAAPTPAAEKTITRGGVLRFLLAVLLLLLSPVVYVLFAWRYLFSPHLKRVGYSDPELHFYTQLVVSVIVFFGTVIYATIRLLTWDSRLSTKQAITRADRQTQ